MNELKGLLILVQQLFGLLIEQPEYSAQILPISIPRNFDKYVAIFNRISSLLKTDAQLNVYNVAPVKIVYNSVLQDEAIVSLLQRLAVTIDIILREENSAIVDAHVEHILSEIKQQLLLSLDVAALESKRIQINEELSLTVTADTVLAVYAIIADYIENLLKEMDDYTLKELDIIYHSN